MILFLYLSIRIRLILMTPSRQRRNDKMYHFVTEWPNRYLNPGWGQSAVATAWNEYRKLLLDRSLLAAGAITKLMNDIIHLSKPYDDGHSQGFVFDGVCGETLIKKRCFEGKRYIDQSLYLRLDDYHYNVPMTEKGYESPTMIASVLSGSYGHILELQGKE